MRPGCARSPRSCAATVTPIVARIDCSPLGGWRSNSNVVGGRGRGKLVRYAELRGFVAELLGKRCSPRQVAHALRVRSPTNPGLAALHVASPAAELFAG